MSARGPCADRGKPVRVIVAILGLTLSWGRQSNADQAQAALSADVSADLSAERGRLPQTSEASALGAPAPPGLASWLAPERTPSVAPGESAPATRYVIALLLLTAMIAGALYVRKRRGGALLGAGRHAGALVLSSTRIGPRAYLVTARVQDKLLLLGVTDNHVTLVSELEDSGQPQRTAGESSGRQLASTVQGATDAIPPQAMVSLEARAGAGSGEVAWGTSKPWPITSDAPAAPRSFRDVLLKVLGGNAPATAGAALPSVALELAAGTVDPCELRFEKQVAGLVGRKRTAAP